MARCSYLWSIVSFFCIAQMLLIAAQNSTVEPAWGPNQDSNCKGSGNCDMIKQGYCLTAVALYDNNTVYNQYTSFTDGNNVFGYGCAAMYKCVSPSDFGAGLTGKELKEAFGIVYGKAKCGRCGSHTLANTRCWVTFNACKNCMDTNGGSGIPLSVQCPPLATNGLSFLMPTTAMNQTLTGIAMTTPTGSVQTASAATTSPSAQNSNAGGAATSSILAAR